MPLKTLKYEAEQRGIRNAQRRIALAESEARANEAELEGLRKYYSDYQQPGPYTRQSIAAGDATVKKLEEVMVKNEHVGIKQEDMVKHGVVDSLQDVKVEDVKIEQEVDDFRA